MAGLLNTTILPSNNENIKIRYINILLQVLNVINVCIILIITMIIIFQDVRIFIMNKDLTQRSLFVTIIILTMLIVQIMLIHTYIPKTKIHWSIIIMGSILMCYTTYFGLNLIQWFTITEEGVLTYKFFKIMLAASYDVKLNAYYAHLQDVVNHITDINFKHYITQTYNIFGKAPLSIQHMPLTGMYQLAVDELTKASQLYEQMLIEANRLSKHNTYDYQKIALISIAVIGVIGITCYIFYNNSGA